MVPVLPARAPSILAPDTKGWNEMSKKTRIRGGTGDEPHWSPPIFFGTNPRNRNGRCYELCVQALLEAPSGTKIVHGAIDGGEGTVGRMGHAWLLLPYDDDAPHLRVWEPFFASIVAQHEFYSWAKAEELAVYSFARVHRFIIVTGHYGPWEERAEVIPERPELAGRRS